MPILEYYSPGTRERGDHYFSHQQQQQRSANLNSSADVVTTTPLQEYYAPNAFTRGSQGYQGSKFDVGINADIFDTLRGFSGPVVSVSFSPDGTKLAAGAKDASIRIWHISKPKPPRLLSGHGAIVEAVAFSSSGQYVASGSGDQTIRVWNAVSGDQARQVLTGHTASVRAVAFSRDEKTIVSGSDDGTVRVWTLKDGSHRIVSGQKPQLSALAISHDSSAIALSSRGTRGATLKLLDLMSSDFRFLSGVDVIAHSLAFSPNGKMLAIGSADNIVRSWYLAEDMPRLLVGHQAPVFTIACSPTDKLIASGSADGTVRIWDSGESQNHFVINNEAKVWAIAYSPDGKTMAIGLGNGSVRLLGTAVPQPDTTGQKRSIWKLFK